MKHLIFITAEPLFYALIIFSGGGRVCLWMLNVFLLITYNTFKYKEWVWTFFDDGTLELDEEVYMLIFAIGWVQLRCISFCFDYVNKKEKNAVETSIKLQQPFYDDLIKLFSYVLYLPVIHTGPLILYSEFEKSLKTRNELKPRIRSFILNFALLWIYRLLLDLAMHYIYFLAMQEQIEVWCCFIVTCKDMWQVKW